MNNVCVTCCNPSDLCFRPIVVGPNSSSQRLSHLLDILLKTFCEKVSRFIRDDLDLINQLPSHVNKNTKLGTLDVISLYSNFPTSLGLHAVKFYMDKFPDLINNRFNQTFILEGLKIVLENNSFAFAEDYYLQVKGTTMGTKLTLTYGISRTFRNMHFMGQRNSIF